MRPRRELSLLVAALAATVALTGCGSSADEDVDTLRLGFFPNLTHAPALVGVEKGIFEAELAKAGVALEPLTFNAGPDAVTALFGGSVDIAYVGPNPTINAYAQSEGAAIRVIAGAASGGASLVVRPGIETVDDLRGRTLATPQLGNTQDVALRHWLKEQGIATTTEGGGEVAIKPQSNAEGLAAYGSGAIDGAWVPEPWVSSYVAAGARVLVDEADLWPDGRFVTTNVVVRTEFLEQHPDIVRAFLVGHVAALESIADDPAGSKAAFNAELEDLTGKTIDTTILDSAFAEVEFTADPLPATLVESAQHAVSVDLLVQDDLDDAGGLPGTLYALGLLDEVLAAAGLPAVDGA